MVAECSPSARPSPWLRTASGSKRGPSPFAARSRGLFTRRRALDECQRRLAPEEAPELFAFLAHLAREVSTDPPSEVYLTDRVDLHVTETAGLFGPREWRILSIGAPVLALTTVEELRAGLAHELGHFAFGDTRLLGLAAHAHAAFRAVLQSTERAPFADSGIGSIEAGFAPRLRRAPRPIRDTQGGGSRPKASSNICHLEVTCRIRRRYAEVTGRSDVRSATA